MRAKARDVLRAPEVDSREVEDRGCQQGVAKPITAYRRRIALGMLLRAIFLTLRVRATGMLAASGRPQLHGDDKGCSIGVMSPMYPPRISSKYEAKLSALAFVLARDEAHLDRLNWSVSTSDIDVARLQKTNYDLRDRAEAVRQPLAEGTAHLARDVERARLLARNVAWRMQQRV